MTSIAIIATGVGVFCLAICQFFNLKMLKMHQRRFESLEFYVYPEFAEKRGWYIGTTPYRAGMYDKSWSGRPNPTLTQTSEKA